MGRHPSDRVGSSSAGGGARLDVSRLGLIRRLELSTWLVVVVMCVLGLMVVFTGSWLLGAYERQRAVIYEFVDLTDVVRGLAAYREGIRSLSEGDTRRAVEAMTEGERLVRTRMSHLAGRPLVDRDNFMSLRRQVMLIDEIGRHALGVGHYLDLHGGEMPAGEVASKRRAISHLVERFEEQGRLADRSLTSLRRHLEERLEQGQAQVGRLVTVAGTIAIVAMLVVSVLSILMLTRSTRQLTGVLEGLRSVSDSLARGEYGIRLPDAVASDVARLFRGFNQMIERLAEHHRTRADYSRRLEDLAYRDQLTGLYNRAMLKRHLERLEKERRPGEHHAIMFLDIDRFKSVNDSLGHPVGDALIQAFAERIQRVLRQEDIVVRLGGDEFAVIVHSIGPEHGPAVVARRIIAELEAPFDVGSFTIHVTTSIGISLFPDDDTDYDELLRKADLAMYHVKEKGRNGYAFYRDELDDQAGERLRLETDLRKALADDEFVIHYQPKLNTHTGEIVGAEALLRWRHPADGMIPPDRFIPILEDSGMIDQVGRWVIDRAVEWSIERDGLHVAVNVATRQLYDPDFVDHVAAALTRVGLAAVSLELEITESLLMENTDTVRRNLAALRELGVRLAIDDFGTGYSSLSYLQRYPVDVLKLDRSFIAGIDEVGASVIAGVVAMAHGLDMAVVAEGVEDKDQLIVLRTLGCDSFQGFLVARPLPVDEFDRFMAGYTPSPELFLEQDSFDENWRTRQDREASGL